MKRSLLSMIGLISAVLLAPALPVIGQETGDTDGSPVRTYDWSPTQTLPFPEGAKLVQEELITGKLVPEGQQPNGKFAYVLEIENTNDRPLTVQLLSISKPGFSNLVYGVTGSIKFDKVQGDAYLEMLSLFPPAQPGQMGREYFTRTLGEAGEMRKISGTSDWRKVSLPFDRTGTATPPDRLQINLYLPGRGTVYFRPLSLNKYGDEAGTVSASWWSASAASWIGGIGGPVIGCLGGLLGALAGRGKARGLVLALWQMLIIAGVVSLIAAVIGFIVKQPDFVTTPLLIFGVVLTTVMGVILPTAKKRYHELEIRRMASIDAMRG